MKKRGHQPTGILINTAKATGFSSVSEMLQHFQASLPNKPGKENSVTANKSKKVNQRKLEKEAIAEMHNCNKKHGAEGNDSRGAHMSKKRKRCRSYELGIKNDADGKKGDVSSTSPRKLVSEQEAKLKIGHNPDQNMSYEVKMTRKEVVKRLEDDKTTRDEIESASTLVVLKQRNANSFLDIPMPLGIELKNVAGLDVSVEDVGNVLQFLEFCAAFGKASDLTCNPYF
ncbi:uncharacterized protein LOC121764893 isoform X2 [Salvia splendens]|uniref:uncharacterized protein LOC121764893 isoform X2 n=1 Tax=Salvia splendens TaxID=180675 RepID=UPI001C2567EE|nr:uncharacterized protein LOC121764893 isoform X2 [Salvia splendens]